MSDIHFNIDFGSEQERLVSLYHAADLLHPRLGHARVFGGRCFLETQLEVITIDEDHQLLDLKELADVYSMGLLDDLIAAILMISGRNAAWNGRTVRLVRCESSDDKVTLTVQSAHYYDYLATNYAAFLHDHFRNEMPSPVRGSTYRELLEPPPQLSLLESSRCANHVGISCLICSSDNHLVLHKRANNITFPGSINPLPSSVWDWDILLDHQSPFQAMRRQLTRKETFLDDVNALVCLGITRELCRAGKPEIFFYLPVAAPFSILRDYILSGAAEQRQIQEIVPIALPRSGDVDESLASLNPWIFDRHDCAPTTQGALWLFGRAIQRGDFVLEDGRWTMSTRGTSSQMIDNGAV